jgi:predicted enzyme related to lactoylglutathione lyase
VIPLVVLGRVLADPGRRERPAGATLRRLGEPSRSAAGRHDRVCRVNRVSGIGGVFVRARDADLLRAWYERHLGIEPSDWGGQQFDWSPGGSTTWSIFAAETPYFGRSDQVFMVNFRVEDLDGMLAQLRAAGVDVVDDVGETEYGRFGWAYDGEGNRFELWQPPPGK